LCVRGPRACAHRRVHPPFARCDRAPGLTVTLSDVPVGLHGTWPGPVHARVVRACVNVCSVCTVCAGVVVVCCRWPAVALAACWQLALVVAGMFPIMVSIGWIQMKFTKGAGSGGKQAFEVVRAAATARPACGCHRPRASAHPSPVCACVCVVLAAPGVSGPLLVRARVSGGPPCVCVAPGFARLGTTPMRRSCPSGRCTPLDCSH
jgi:hypothetical protein